MHSSRNLEIGTEAEAKKWFLLAGSSCLTQPAFLHKQGLNTFPGWHSPLSLRPSQNNHFIKKMPQRHAHRPIWRKQFLAWVILFFLVTLVCVVTKPAQTLNIGSRPEQNEYHVLLQNHGVKTSMVLAQNQRSWQARVLNTQPQLLNLWQSLQSIHWRKDGLLNEQCWQNWMCTYRKIKLDLYILPCATDSKKDRRL